MDLIVKKRNGQPLSEQEISFLVRGYVSGEIADYQMSSLAMAVYFRGMDAAETGHLTRAMIDSGDVIDLSSLPWGAIVDKHSTGGVGDKVSLILAPLAASCGCLVPMMSGRALGHTGGTLDKLESIPGYRTDLSVGRFVELVGRTGFAMTGQSERIVPADRLLYALRDVTGTVESIPLITASIMSKKFAEGARALVFDVKAGSGAFMKEREQARELAVSLVRTGASMGRQVRALISDMDQPLGLTVGNFLEVRECVDCLRGGGPRDLVDLTVRLTAHMLVLTGIEATLDAAEQACRRRLADGSAWSRFLENVRLQGGDPHAVEEPAKGPRAARIEEIPAPRGGHVHRVDAYAVGTAAGRLGASRARKEDPVHAEVGVELLRTQGQAVSRGEPLCRLHAYSEAALEEARRLVMGAYTIGEEPAGPPASRVLEEISVDDLE